VTSVELTRLSRHIKHANHFLPLLIIIAVNALLLSNILATDGIIMRGDFNFPIRNENFEKSYYPFWNDLTSQSNFERLPRLVMMTPFLLLSLAGLEVSIILKVLVFFVFTLLAFAMYLFLESLQKHIRGRGHFSTKPFSLIGAFVFAFNPVSLQFLGGISILYSVAILPLLLYVILTRLNSKYFPLYVSGLLILSLGHPFVLLINTIVSFVFLIIVHAKMTKLRLITKKIGYTVVTFLLLFAWYWIPYVNFPVTSTELGRDEGVSKSAINAISNNDRWDIFFLERDRFLYVNTVPQEPALFTFHYLSLGIIVGLAIGIPLLIFRRAPLSITLFFITGFFVATLFAFGTRGPLGESYYDIVSENILGWVFRSPLKFQLYQSFFMSAMFGLFASFLQMKVRKNYIYFASLIFLVAGVSFQGIYDINTSSFRPISIPAPYYEINEILAQKNDGYKVIYYPVYGGNTTWSEGHGILAFDARSTSVPTFSIRGNYQFVQDMLEEPYTESTPDNSGAMFRTHNYYDFLSSLGIKYIVFHNDRNNEIDEQNLDYLLNSYQLDLLYHESNWFLFEITSEVPKLIRTTTNTIFYDGLPSGIHKIAKPELSVLSLSPDHGYTFDDHPTNEILSTLNTSAPAPISNQPHIDDPRGVNFDLRNNYEDNWKIIGERNNLTLTFNEKDGLFISSLEDRVFWLYSNPVKVSADDLLLSSFHMRFENEKQINVRLIGYFANENEWRDIGSIARGIKGTSDWKDYWTIIQIPNNITEIRYAISTGNILDSSDRKGTISIDKVSLLNLARENTQPTKVIGYEKIDPTKWIVRVNATEPYLLILPETYDSGWSAIVLDKEKGSIMLNGMVNAFYIEDTGVYSIIVEYKPQTIFEYSSLMSLATLSAFLVHFIVGKNSIMNRMKKFITLRT